MQNRVLLIDDDDDPARNQTVRGLGYSYRGPA